MGNQVEFFHVKSHADDKTKGAKKVSYCFSMPETVNIRCDTLATDYMEAHPEPRIAIPFIDSSQVMLQIDGIPITRNTRRAIHDMVGRDFIFKYYKDSNYHGWCQATSFSVDWRNFNKGLNTFVSTNQLFVMKWNNRDLPFGKRNHRNFPHEPDSCPHCSSPDEDDEHFIRCPTQHKFRTDFRKSLNTRFDSKKGGPTCLQLRRLLLGFFDAYFEGRPYRPQKYGYPNEYHRLIEGQHRIGWEHIWKGKFHRDWAVLQEKSLEFRNLASDRNTGSIWLTKLLTHMWGQIRIHWEARKLVLHGTDETSLAIKTAKLIPRIEYIYSLKPRLLEADQDLLAYPLEDRLKSPYQSLLQFVKLTEPVVARCLRDAEQHAQLQTNITDWFRPVGGASAPGA
jgi:hypothetical protein